MSSSEGAEFATYAHELVEWIARYLDDPGRHPVVARVAPGDIRRSLPSAPPARGEPLADILADFQQRILPGVTHWNHPGFFAYFAISSTTPGILAEMLTAALNVNAMLWKTSPSATELEEVALDWLRQMLGLPAADRWFGVINDTASISTLLALAAAREAKEELAIRRRGMAGRGDLPPLRIYASTQAHSSVDKAAITLGVGQDNIVHIGTDAAFRMRAELLADAIARDRAAGLLPLAVVATVGTTSSTSIDPVPAIADICRREDVWLHVDAAYAGVAAILPEKRDLLDGVSRADSLVVNPHKWMFTPVDLSAFYTRRPDVLKRAFSLVPEYLTTADDDAVNLMDYGVQLGRRFRALKLWMVIRAYGVEGLADRIRAHIALARRFADWVDGDDAWEVLAPVPLSTVCFRHVPAAAAGDEAAMERANRAILEAVNASGEVFLSHTKLDGRYALRLAIGNVRTEERHVARAWQLLRDASRLASRE